VVDGAGRRIVKLKVKVPQGLAQLAFVVAVVGGALYLSSALAPRVSSTQPTARIAVQKPGVSILAPSTIDFEPVVTLSGVVENRTRTDISAQVGGRVIRVSPSFVSGATVLMGEVLFELDPADYELALETTGAEIAATQSELEQLQIAADLSVREWRETYPDRDVPPLAAKVPQLAAAQARLKAAEASRGKAQLALERTRILAPFDARILQTQLDEGQLITPNQLVGSAFALENVEVAAAVSAAEISLIAPHIGRAVLLDRPGYGDGTGKGVIVRTDAQLDARTRLGRIYIRIIEAPELMVGEFVNVVVRGNPVPGALQLPASALVGRETVWVVSGMRLAPRRVTVLSATGDTLVVAPFDTADGVVVLPPSEPEQGLEVRVLAAAATPAELARNELADVR